MTEIRGYIKACVRIGKHSTKNFKKKPLLSDSKQVYVIAASLQVGPQILKWPNSP